ncbi:MAG: hypothetical protein ACYC64_19940 [Armatimonadota bacterium]
MTLSDVLIDLQFLIHKHNIAAELTYGTDLTCGTNGPNFCTSLQPLTGLNIGHSYDTNDISS